MKPTWSLCVASFSLGVGAAIVVLRVRPSAAPVANDAPAESRPATALERPRPEELVALPPRDPAPRPIERAATAAEPPAEGTVDPRRAGLLARIRQAGGRVGVRKLTKNGEPDPSGVDWLETTTLGDARPVVALVLPSTAMDTLAELAALPDLTELHFTGNEKEIDLAQLPAMPHLEHVVFDATRASARGLAPLARQRRLARVEFGDVSLDGETLGVVAALDGVRSLTLDSGRVTDETLAALANATKLEQLNLDDALVTDAGLAHLAGMSKLRELVLTGTRITGEGFRHLANLAALERVDLDKTRVNDEGLRHLAALPALRFVDLEATDITDAGLVHLVRSRTLAELILEGTRISDGAFATLGRLATLEALSVLNTRITAEGLERFRSAHPEVRVEE